MTVCKIICANYENPWSMTHQAVKTAKGKVVFQAHDLFECPEDATLYRDMFNANDYVRALKQGMAIAQHGYDSIEVEYKDFESFKEYDDFLNE